MINISTNEEFNKLFEQEFGITQDTNPTIKNGKN